MYGISYDYQMVARCALSVMSNARVQKVLGPLPGSTPLFYPDIQSNRSSMEENHLVVTTVTKYGSKSRDALDANGFKMPLLVPSH